MKSLPHPAIPRPRFQFTLGEVYVVLILLTFAQVVWMPVIADDNRLKSASPLVPVVLMTVVTLCGAFVGLWRAHVRRLDGATNAGSALWYVLVAWAAFLFCFWTSVWAGVICIPVTLGLAALGMWIGNRSRRDHMASLIIAALVVVLGWATLAGTGTVLISMTLHTRCGSPESAAIAACKTYAEAQDIYHRYDWDSDGVLEYATSITGDNSLFEKHAGSCDLTLVDSAFANAEGDPGTARPKAGYVFKVLAAQGPHAPGGARSYLDENGNLVNGYALIACPAVYDKTGRSTFIVGPKGTVYQCDLGEGTHAFYLNTFVLDPGPLWVVAE
ncbi:MAG: DUF2950 domain-containing protein [Planctomycetes bacterium]|nr:DUF2950 domain-containing protein [Planctomycetota bacterium]